MLMTIKKMMLGFAAALAVCLLFGTQAVAQKSQLQLAGEWEGVLAVSGAKLRLVFHLHSKAGKGYSATLDSPDQKAFGIPVNKVSVTNRDVTLEIAAIRGGYTGTLAADGTTIDGQWSQGGQSFPLELRRKKANAAKPPAGTPLSKAEIARIAGHWQGALKVSGVELRIIFNIAANEDGTLQATLDSPDQGAKDIPTSETIFTKNHLKIAAAAIAGTYEGDLQADGKTITGTWIQRGTSHSLDLARVDKTPEVKRPQEPQKPYPYREEDVSYPNRDAGITLAGTLTLPRGDGPFPAVVLITGSGPQNRDEAILGHKPFLVLADYLTRKGIAVLRVDDRGVGKSTGDFAKATTEDFATDVAAGVNYLKSRQEIDPVRIGLIGHSEGGLIAPMVASRSPEVTFIVLMAGPGLPGDEILLMQTALISRAGGASDEMIKMGNRLARQMYTLIKQEKDDSAAVAKLRQLQQNFWASLSDPLKKKFKKAGADPSQIENNAEQLVSPWFRFFLSYDPRPVLQKVKCPVLAINGEKDLQVPPQEDLREIEKALRAGGNRQFTTKVFPGLNHLFQRCETGAPAEYAKIEETIAPAVLENISDWILKIAGER